ncbi:oxygenase MpaB family protein [Noviherbaspirillum saxi]|uniref:oxygenase MpaB family protein n=1 Tax=Noviherbaspirillum saxi TaxID=2320863 RepID=UPI001F29E669|nr:oxygenase MpaB family protein [Noviherbaspirillum saxi]
MIRLPHSLQRYLETQASSLLYPHASSADDFLLPAGEPALVAPDSVSWRVFKNPVALFIGGITAVLLELAHPAVRSGVWEHTSFRSNPRQRIQRTGYAAMMTVYGPRSRTEAMIAAVRQRHGQIGGVTPSGMPYRADDPALLSWVHATAAFGFMEAFHAYVGMLDAAQREAFFAEGKMSSRLYGADDAPISEQQCLTLFETTLPCLEPSSIVLDFLNIVAHSPLLPAPLDHAQGLLLKASIAILPAAIRERLCLPVHWNLHPWQAAVVRRLGRIAERIPLASSPATLACQRLGLPHDYLYAPRGLNSLL